MHFLTIGQRRYAQFERLRQVPELIHAFSLRPNDLSPRPDARRAERSARRRQMAGDFNLNADRLCACGQVHGDRVAVVDATTAGRLLDGFDAAVTNAPALPLMAFSADCPLVLLYDPRRAAIGVVHGSWRCTVAQLAARAVEALRRSFGSDPNTLLAGIGPGAGPCCYEVKQDVFVAAARLPQPERLFTQRAGKLFFDLWEANRAQLLAAGVPDEQIEIAGLCTLCRNDLFYSYRREGPGCGHFGLLAALVGKTDSANSAGD